jgi:hypothetical protein
MVTIIIGKNPNKKARTGICRFLPFLGRSCIEKGAVYHTAELISEKNWIHETHVSVSLLLL